MSYHYIISYHSIYIYMLLHYVVYRIFQSLRPALLNVREMCHRISDMGLCKVEKGHTYTLHEFKEAQFTQLTEVMYCHRLFIMCSVHKVW